MRDDGSKGMVRSSRRCKRTLAPFLNPPQRLRSICFVNISITKPRSNTIRNKCTSFNLVVVVARAHRYTDCPPHLFSFDSSFFFSPFLTWLRSSFSLHTLALALPTSFSSLIASSISPVMSLSLCATDDHPPSSHIFLLRLLASRNGRFLRWLLCRFHSDTHTVHQAVSKPRRHGDDNLREAKERKGGRGWGRELNEMNE